jgi:hypothetical protein
MARPDRLDGGEPDVVGRPRTGVGDLDRPLGTVGDLADPDARRAGDDTRPGAGQNQPPAAWRDYGGQ